jgi:hypothetical protein
MRTVSSGRARQDSKFTLERAPILRYFGFSLLPHMTPARVSALLLCCSAPVFAAFAQAPAPALPPLPKDPTALLQLASQVNGLDGDSLQPWHLRATWTMPDKGQIGDHGTFEEWWAGPDRSETVLTADGFHQTRWVTSHGSFMTGDDGFPPWVFELVLQSYLTPAPNAESLARLRPRSVQASGKDRAMRCAGQGASTIVTKFCFDGNLPAIRIRGAEVTEAAFNNLIQFQGRYLAQDVHVVRLGMPPVDIHLDEVGSLHDVAAADLSPPANAVPASPWGSSPKHGLIFPVRISGETPQLDPNGASRGSVVAVELSIVVEKDGSVSHIEVIGGTPSAQQPYVNAVKTWRYRPATLDGSAIPLQLGVSEDIAYH